MVRNLQYFYSAFFVTIISIIVAIVLVPQQNFYTFYIIITLAVLEISLSFDNAVINARILANMPLKWQKLFIWIGLPIAVFGMRLVFPILLVTLTTTLSFPAVFTLAINNPMAYESALQVGLPLIFAFGGGFLMMVSLKFFLLEVHKTAWIKWIEQNRLLLLIRKHRISPVFIALIVGGIIFYIAPETENIKIFMAFLVGVIIHEMFSLLSRLFNQNAAGKFAQNGLIGFIYLEMLDASFSLDGVIGAFAISRHIFIIMIGLGIGAMYVRALTLFFIHHKTLAKFQYLEHGAHYAIGFLAMVMLIKINVHVPEFIAALVSISLIIAALIHSVAAKRKALINH